MAGDLLFFLAQIKSKSDLKSVYYLHRSVPGFSFSSFSSPNFPSCSSPRESASVIADYLRSHFSLSLSQRPCAAEPETTFPSSAKPRVLRSLTCPPAPPSSPMNFLRLSPTYPCPLPLPRQSCLSHAKAPSSLRHGFSSSHFQSFLVFAFLFSIWKISFIIPIHKMGKPLDSPASFRPISLSHLLRIKAF